MPKPSARLVATVNGVASKPTPITMKELVESIGQETGRLINEAADLGDDGHYRAALKRESKAQAYLDVLAFINTGAWPHEGETKPTGNTPSEILAERYEELVGEA